MKLKKKMLFHPLSLFLSMIIFIPNTYDMEVHMMNDIANADYCKHILHVRDNVKSCIGMTISALQKHV